MRSFQHHYVSEGEATVTLESKEYADGTKGMRIQVSTDMPPNSITIEVPDLKELKLK